MTWIMRRASLWAGPFRLKVLPEDQPVVDDYRPILRPEACLGRDGPLQSSGPESLTRWMGVPWQTDEASCLSGYDTSTYLPLPTFWAARVPNQVLSQEAYRRAIDERLPPAQRLKHFDYRQFWLRDLGVSYQARINDMVARWHQLGNVAEQAGPLDWASVNMPQTVWVETERAAQYSRGDPTWHQVLVAERGVMPHPRRSPSRLRACSPTRFRSSRNVVVAAMAAAIGDGCHCWRWTGRRGRGDHAGSLRPAGAGPRSCARRAGQDRRVPPAGQRTGAAPTGTGQRAGCLRPSPLVWHPRQLGLGCPD
jgi:hypothetical protein